MPNNKRIFYACQALQVANVDAAGNVDSYFVPKGIQSVGITTNFNLEKIFQLGQLAVYDQIENNPEVEITVNKIIDGTRPLMLCLMAEEKAQTSGNLVSMQNNRVNVKVGIYPDTDVRTSGTTPVATLACTGMYLSSINFTFPTDGNATEEGTLVGNNKIWLSGSESKTIGGATITALGATMGDEFISPATARRWKFNKGECVFPTGAGGMRITGGAVAPLSNVTVSCDFGREAIYTLGQYDPYYRYINFPVDVNTEITSLAIDGDFIDMNEVSYSCASSSGNALAYFPIKFVICGSGSGDKLTIDLGSKNKIQSINYTGGDTGGGNVELSYSFQNSSELNIEAEGSFTDVTAGQQS